MIFSRNVVTGLESSHPCSVLERMASQLTAGGMLIITPVKYTGPAGHPVASGKNGNVSRSLAQDGATTR